MTRKDVLHLLHRPWTCLSAFRTGVADTEL